MSEYEPGQKPSQRDSHFSIQLPIKGDYWGIKKYFSEGDKKAEILAQFYLVRKFDIRISDWADEPLLRD